MVSKDQTSDPYTIILGSPKHVLYLGNGGQIFNFLLEKRTNFSVSNVLDTFLVVPT